MRKKIGHEAEFEGCGGTEGLSRQREECYKGLVWGGAGARSEVGLEIARNRQKHVAGFGPQVQRLCLCPEDSGSLCASLSREIGSDLCFEGITL